ncbi:hypothetical protein DCC62_14980 [candidate division KSB1 bacterium]|nr:MAG: hypothetical protein DCC62_14980 [candidate division KSB1 bacterium]
MNNLSAERFEIILSINHPANFFRRCPVTSAHFGRKALSPMITEDAEFCQIRAVPFWEFVFSL